MRKFVVFVALAIFSGFPLLGAPRFELRDGDRVVFLGDTLIERAQESGWIETALDAQFPERRFIVRNLGWSGDTPAGISRASFDFADTNKTFQRLVSQVVDAKPTVIFLGYGMASSFDGAAGIGGFKTDLNRLIDAVNAGASGQIRWVVLSPLRHQKMAPPLPDPAAHNASLALYTQALRQIASERNFTFVDLFAWQPGTQATEITDDGIHLKARGYELLAEEIMRQLGWETRFSRFNTEAIEQMRQLIVGKDQLFFDRWRPQNETYLFGFRKHEQGKNASEIPQFDPLIDQAQARIYDVQKTFANGGKIVALPSETEGVIKTNAVAKWSMPDFEIAPGFTISLWAEYPMLSKPTQMNFDPQGRLWVASSKLYPQIAPGQKPDDQILVLEDTTGSGKADKSTVFARGLFLPTGVVPGDGGCYVAQSTELLHFDTGPDGRATNRRVVLSGFGTEDTHHHVHTLTWGPDGMLYFDQSIYIHSHIETPHGVVRLNSGGLFHLRPATMELGVFLRGFCNPWGHQFDSFGQSFVTDGAGFQGISWGIPGATYFTYADMRRELQSISPGNYPKFCGLEIVANAQFPDDWRGDFLTEDFRAHRLVRFHPTEEGSGYVTQEMPTFLLSRDETFRPIDLKFGPDGALYVADWANPIINHGEVDFRDPRRDHEHGRIWRITANSRPALPRPDGLLQASNEKLLDELLSTNAYNVRQARRVLTERGNAILSDLEKWTGRQTGEPALLQALWMYQSIDVRNDPLLDRLLGAADGHIRAAATRVLEYWPRIAVAPERSPGGGPAPDECYARALSDPFPRVRVEALRAIAKVPSARSAELALDTLNHPMDSFEDYALWLTINDLARPWVESLRSGAWNPVGHDKQLEFALQAIPAEEAAGALREVLATHPLRRDGPAWEIDLIGRAGRREAVSTLYEKLLGKDFDSATTARAWAALNDAAKTRQTKPASDIDKLTPFIYSPEESTRIQAIHLAGNWKGPQSAVPELLAMAGDPGTSAAERRAVFEALRNIGGPETVNKMESVAREGQPYDIRRQAVLTLAALDIGRAAPLAVKLLAETTSEPQAMEIWRALLNHQGMADALTPALPRQGFSPTAGKAGLLAVRETARSEPQLVLALSRASGLQSAQALLTTKELADLGQAVREHGDAERGERIFRRPQQNCMSCHSIGGVGAKVGPDLTSLGASAQLDYIIESVYYPNKQIKEGYNSFLVDTKDGETLSGIFVRQNDREYVIRTAGDQEVAIPRANILSIKPGGSLMPSGLADNLSAQEQIDLFRFLSELGKPGAFDASKPNVARSWRVAAAARVPEQDRAREFASGNFAGASWHSAPSLVDGELLRDDLKTAAGANAGEILVASKFRTGASGPVSLHLSAPPDARIWVDGKPASEPLRLQLSSAVHDIVVEINTARMPKSLRLSSDEATFLSF
jgi:putative heme-binding domain-containing protein